MVDQATPGPSGQATPPQHQRQGSKAPKTQPDPPLAKDKGADRTTRSGIPNIHLSTAELHRYTAQLKEDYPDRACLPTSISKPVGDSLPTDPWKLASAQQFHEFAAKYPTALMEMIDTLRLQRDIGTVTTYHIHDSRLKLDARDETIKECETTIGHLTMRNNQLQDRCDELQIQLEGLNDETPRPHQPTEDLLGPSEHRNESPYLNPEAVHHQPPGNPPPSQRPPGLGGPIHPDREGTTESLRMHSGKSHKMPDPERYATAGGDVEFESWRIELENKLMVNDDHFNSEAAKIAYVYSRTKGEAQAHLTHARSHTIFRTATEAMNYLEEMYGDRNKRQKARRRWIKLRMGVDDKFNNFMSTFQMLASILQYSHREQTDALKDMLPDRLRNVWEACPFEPPMPKIKEMLQRADDSYHGSKKYSDPRAEPKARSTPIFVNKLRQPFQPASAPRAPYTQTQQAPRLPPIPSKPAGAKDYSDRSCYICGKPGHIASDPRFHPKNPKAAQVSHVDGSYYWPDSDQGYYSPEATSPEEPASPEHTTIYPYDVQQPSDGEADEELPRKEGEAEN